MKKRYMYLHTMNGRPAGWFEEQICYANALGWYAPLVKDLKTIRKQQNLSIKFRRKMGWFEETNYSYVKVEVVK